MHVLHLVTRDQRRGAELDALHVRDMLLARGVTGTVRALAPPLAGGERLGVAALGPAPLHPRTLRRLRGVAAGHDLVVAHGSTTLPATRLALLGTSTRFVYRTIGVPSAWAGTPVRRARVRWMLTGATAVAALGEGSRRDVVAHYGLPADRVVPVGCAQPDGAFSPPDPARRAAARRALDLPADVAVAVTLSALAVEKRLQDAVAAVLRVPGLMLLVAGDGPERERLRALVPVGAARRVRLLGQVREVAAVLDAADVALLTSATEGVPGFLVQAGLSGLPAVATRVGYVDDVVRDGVTGRLVPVADVDAIAAALREALHRRDWGPAARTRCAERFSSEVVGGRWHDLLAGL